MNVTFVGCDPRYNTDVLKKALARLYSRTRINSGAFTTKGNWKGVVTRKSSSMVVEVRNPAFSTSTEYSCKDNGLWLETKINDKGNPCKPADIIEFVNHIANNC